MAGHARHAAIDHRADAFDGDGAFGHVGGEDNLAAAARPHGAVLFLGRLIAVQRQQQPAVACGQRRAGRLRAADFGRAGQEDQHVALLRTPGQPPQRGGHLLFERRRGVRRVLDFQRVLAALGAHHARVAQVCGHGRGIERGGHHHQAQIGPAGALQAAEQRQRQVAFQVALVELVEHHGSRCV